MSDQRNASIDIARGIGIVLVVLGHALIGVALALPGHLSLTFLVIVIYAVHMPLFFLISGALVGSFLKRPWAPALKQLFRRLVWPYFLWSFILLLSHFVMSGYTNTKVSAFQPWTILWSPPAVMWFLQTLFFAMLLARLLSWAGRPAILVIGAVLTVAPYVAGSDFLQIRYIGIFLIATLFGRQLGTDLSARTGPVVLSLLIMLLTALYAFGDVATVASDESAYPAFSLAYIPAIFAGPLLLFAFSRYLAQASLTQTPARGLALVGQYTMPIFVMHILLTAGARIVLMRLGVESPALLVVTGTIAGVFIPFVAAKAAERLKFSPYLGW